MSNILFTAIGQRPDDNVLAAIGQQLGRHGFEPASVEQVENSISLESFTPSVDDKYCLIFGNEVKGVDQQVVDNSDMCIEIPQFGTKHSLNVSVSMGVVIWDLVSKMRQ